MSAADRGKRRKTVEKLFRVLVAGGVALATGAPGAGAAEEPKPPPAQGGQDPGQATGAKAATPSAEKAKAGDEAAAKKSDGKAPDKPKPPEAEGGGVRGW